MGTQKHIIDREKVTSSEIVGYREQQSFIYSDSIIPSPQELEEYKKQDPDFPKFFMEMAKEEQQHRFKIKDDIVKLQERELKLESRNEIWGYVFAILSLLLVVGLILVGFYFSYPWISAVVGAVGLSAIVSSFVKGRKYSSRN